MPSTLPDTYSYTRYRRAEESVDDAALHRPTLERFETELDRLAEQSANPLRIVDVGGGIGSMCRRLLRWNVLPENVTYVVLDADPETVGAGCETMREWVAAEDRDATWESEDRLYLPESATTVRFVADDAFRHLEAQTYDALVGHAFAGTIDLPDALFALLDGVESGGVCYFPITFDGHTAFRPSDAGPTRAILEAYHESMNLDGGSAQFGGALLDAVVAADGELLSAGGSDRVVSPPYEGEQAYYLHHVLHRVEQSVGGGDALDDDAVRRWVRGRHEAVESEELTYLAQNLDVLFRAP